MAWRLNRRITIAPGVRINLARSGPSLSIGRTGHRVTYSRAGRRTTIGIPGTGVYHTRFEPWTRRGGNRPTCTGCGSTASKGAGYCGRCGREL